MKKVILWKLLIVIFVIHLPVRIYAAVGGISTVDSAGDAGKYNSLVLDSSGNPHISYHAVGSGLRYTHYNGSSWEIETVDRC